MQPLVSASRSGGTARIRFDNAARRNAMTERGLDDLVVALERAAAEPECASIRLEMVGDTFCGGWDTTSFASMSSSSAEDVAAALAASDAALARIRRLPVPVVGVVRGPVVGFGVGLLLAMHVAIATEDVRLSLSEVRHGFAPAGVGHALAQVLPLKLCYPLLTGVMSADAPQLQCWGLVSEVLAIDAADSRADEIADALEAAGADVVRAVLEVVSASTAGGDPSEVHRISARTIVRSGQ